MADNDKKEPAERSNPFMWLIRYVLVRWPDLKWTFEAWIGTTMIYSSVNQDGIRWGNEQEVGLAAALFHAGRASVVGLEEWAIRSEIEIQDRSRTPSIILPDGTRKVVDVAVVPGDEESN